MKAYTLFTAPAIFIITGTFWHYLYRYKNKFRFRWIIIAILVLLLALPVRYSIERIKPFARSERNPQWTKELRTLGVTLSDRHKTVIFNTERPIETMFYVNCTAYSSIPDSSTLESIAKKGYDIFIRNNSMEESELVKIEQNNIILEGHNMIYWQWQSHLP